MNIEQMKHTIASSGQGEIELYDLRRLTEKEIRTLYFRLVQGCTLKETGKLAYDRPVGVARTRQIEFMALRKLRRSLLT